MENLAFVIRLMVIGTKTKKKMGQIIWSALEECPKENDENNIAHTKKNLVEEKGQCLISCSTDNKYKYALR